MASKNEMAYEAPLVSVIIPVFNAQKDLARCVGALAAQSFSQESFEVIVVDNHSVPPVEGLPHHPKYLSIIKESRPGSYAARNAGITLARGEILAFTDADCLPDEDWLEKGMVALGNMKDHRVVGGAIDMFIPEDTDRSPAALYDLCLGLRQEKYWIENEFFITANLFVPAVAFKEVGLFRTDVFSGGDAEWSRRAVEMGFPLRYAPEAVVRHPVRADWRSLRRKVLRTAQGGSDPLYQAALDASRRERRWGSGKVTAVRRVIRSGQLRNWRERASVFLMAILVAVWNLEGRLRYRLNQEAYR